MVSAHPITEISKEVFLIFDKMFPLYLIQGKKDFLIDTAVIVQSTYVENSIKKILKNKKLDAILLTHSHYDHTGLCSYLQKKFQCPIYSSQRTKEILEDKNAIEFIDDLNQKFKKQLKSKINIHFEKPQEIKTVSEGDRIPISKNHYIEVYETPGHTKCSISFMIIPEKILFPGDSLGIIAKNGTIFPLFLSNFKQYSETIQKLTKLRPEILALPHNRYIKGEKKIQIFFKKTYAYTQKTKEFMIKMLRTKNEIEKMAKKILEKKFANSTIMGPKEALLINVSAMLRVIQREYFEKK